MLLSVVARLYSFIYNKCHSLSEILLKRCYQQKFAYVGKNVRFHVSSSVFQYNTISIGSNTFINRGAYFSGIITIGENVMFGPYVLISSGRHDYEKIGVCIIDQGSIEPEPVVIEDDCWIGGCTAIMRGVTIGEGTVVGAMSVVTKDMPPYTVCVGNPCRPVKLRYTDIELREHLKLRGRVIDTTIERRLNI